jgi:WD40 repeat protein
VSEDGTARVWEDATGQWQSTDKMRLLPAFRAHQGPIYAVACSPDGQYVATGGFNQQVLLWRPDGIPQITPRELYEMQIKGDRIPGTPYRELVGHNGPIRSVEFGGIGNKDARDLVLVTGADDNLVKVWNVDRESTAERIRPVKTFRGHGGYVRGCVFNSDCTWILSVSHDWTAKRWSLDKDAQTEVQLINGTPLDGHKDHVDAVAFSFTKDGKKVATASRDNTAHVYDLKDTNQLSREHTMTEGHNNLIPCGVYFDDGRKLATASLDNTVRVWDMLYGTENLKLSGERFSRQPGTTDQQFWMCSTGIWMSCAKCARGWC